MPQEPEDLTTRDSATEPKDRSPILFTPEELRGIADQFRIEPVTGAEEFAEKGNINFHTYSVHCAEGHEYLLQCINGDVFKKPRRVMQAMIGWIDAQHSSLAKHRPKAAERWEPITLIESEKGSMWHEHSNASGVTVWRLMRLIQGVVSYKSLGQAGPENKLSLAEEMGRGLALSADFALEMPVADLKTSLPGYRDTAGYYRQFHSVLAGHSSLESVQTHLPEDEEVRESTQALYTLAIDADEARRRREDPEAAAAIEYALSQEDRARSLQDGMRSGQLRETAIHGDTKIENFLFCQATGRVRSLVDLDTIMPYTWLADWGDMVRSLCNLAGEKEPDPSRIQVDMDVYDSCLAGFLSTARGMTREELKMMAPAVQAIALELGVRFLTDYLRGDNYFALGPGDPGDLNKIRGIGQLTLAKRLGEVEGRVMESVTGRAGIW